MKQINHKNNIAVVIKIGDNNVWRHLQVVTYIDNSEWDVTPVLSDHMGKVYGIIELPRASVPDLKNILTLNQAYMDAGSNNRYVLDEYVVGAGKIAEWQSALTIAPVAQTGVWVFKDEDLGPPGIPDFNIVTAGSYTCGGGGDYATFTAAVADTGDQTGDLTFTLISSITENSAIASNHDNNGFNYTMTSSSSHLGDPTAGNIVSANHAGSSIAHNMNGLGVVDVGNFTLKALVVIGASFGIVRPRSRTAGQVNKYHDLMLDGNGQTGNSFRAVACTDGDPDVRIWNCVMWGIPSNCVHIGSAMPNGFLIENCTLYNNAGGNRGIVANNVATVTVRNCAVYDWDTVCYASKSNATGINNVSSDLSATGGWGVEAGAITGAVVGNDTQSTDDTNSAYMDITEGGGLDGAGVVNTIADRTTCIRGRPVPGPNGTSIGAAEIPTPEPPPVEVARVTESHIAISTGIGIE